MIIYLKNPNGDIERIDALRGTIRGMLKSGYSRLSTKERLEYVENEKKERKALQPKPDMLDIYFVAPQERSHDGYGATSETIIENLHSFGVFANRQYNNQRIGFVYNYPYALEDLQCEYKILYTMFESTKMPDDWGRYLRMADKVLVPSEFCRRVMKSQFGVDPEVVPLGYDNATFQHIDRNRKQGDVFTFLHYDAFKFRKGWDIVLSAYDQEFTEKDNVRLIMKTTVEKLPFVAVDEYRNLEVIHKILTPQELQELMADADCFVFPSRGEGFGLTPLEAMATGLPVIIPNATGMSEYFDWELMPQLDVKPIKAKYSNERFGNMDLGLWYQPTIESVRKAMRQAYNSTIDWGMVHHDIAFAEYAKKFTIYKTCKKLAEIAKAADMELGENKANTIVFLTEDCRHITGGRYYSWWCATALKAAGFDVAIYTNRMPPFVDEFKQYPKPTVYLVDDIKKVDVKGKMYFGSPVVGSIRAAQLAKKYNKQAFLEIFDPFPLLEKYKGQKCYPEWDGLLGMIRENDFIHITSLCNFNNEVIYWWLNKTKKQVHTVYPCINSRERDKALVENGQEIVKKKNWVTFVSRLDHHKRLDHVLDAIEKTDCELHVITSIDGIGFEKMVKERGLKSRVKIHWKCNDEEKFEIIKQSRATINAAMFEGFGMWLVESVACGVPVVCYDYPIFREIASTFGEGADLRRDLGIYFAEYGNSFDLTQQLQKALSDAPKLTPRDNFDFPAMVGRFNDILRREPKIGVVMCALNEEQYIEASLNSISKHPSIAKIAVVEGCVEKNEHAAGKDGLSVDDTKGYVVLAMSKTDKIVYDRYGWAGNKSELRNRALQLLGKDMDYILVVDADEVWKQEDLDKLVALIKDQPDLAVVWFNFLHFWKQPDLIATGGQWEAKLFRFFKYEDKTLHWRKHETPVVNRNGISITELGKELTTKDINVYHYGYMKDEKNIADKLKYYAARDKDLTVKNTWSGWQKGDPTQPTHGGGSTATFSGTHPLEVNNII